MHFSAEYILSECREQAVTISEFFRQTEAELVGLTAEELDEKMLEVLEIMWVSSE